MINVQWDIQKIAKLPIPEKWKINWIARIMAKRIFDSIKPVQDAVLIKGDIYVRLPGKIDYVNVLVEVNK